MLNVIRFLERIGSEAQWGDATKGEMELALMDVEVEDSVRSAILDKDAAQLQVLLQQKPLVGFIMPGEEEEEEEEEDDPPGEMVEPQDLGCSPSFSAASLP